MDSKLRFRKDGTFKIVQFTDLHWQNGEAEDLRTQRLMERVLSEEKPDLVVFTGDLVFSLGCRDAYASAAQAVSAVAGSGTPWAAVFGNHDSEGGVSRDRLMETLAGQPGCLASAGPEAIHGVGNYALTVTGAGGGTKLVLYFLDSGSYSALDRIPGYDWIREDQIDWFRERAAALRQPQDGPTTPSLVFFHIPLPEYREVWRTRRCDGRRFESISCPKLNSGLFAALAEAGGVLGTFCGHDHINDFEGDLYGIRLTYGRATGYHTYGRLGFKRGARVIELQGEGARYATWIRLAGGRKLSAPRTHLPLKPRQ
ncbi:metallophosphoesterase family protein [Cohnella sp. JJ-181]|uniref:metallophosphoesterase family protein n=1 Tax=Cohnella rhizoplanae TaxID=2974897 RepID=UPI0022FFC393|nr:metallophosphoesterase family protein [Cohnella sp. JJ-181]CAI6080518.1 3',5'-cyclic adenosine monophosphate phosphodiesterase CpdA [Cohnella sp. JJ-181]